MYIYMILYIYMHYVYIYAHTCTYDIPVFIPCHEPRLEQTILFGAHVDEGAEGFDASHLAIGGWRSEGKASVYGHLYEWV